MNTSLDSLVKNLRGGDQFDLTNFNITKDYYEKLSETQ